MDSIILFTNLCYNNGMKRYKFKKPLDFDLEKQISLLPLSYFEYVAPAKEEGYHLVNDSGGNPVIAFGGYKAGKGFKWFETNISDSSEFHHRISYFPKEIVEAIRTATLKSDIEPDFNTRYITAL